jgi:endo-beta-N-acetylglucosaminidase D
MFKKRNLVKLVALLVMTFSLLACMPMNKSHASDPITGNNSFETAYNFGYWKYKSGMTILPVGENEAYYSFTVNSGERIMDRLY